MTEPDGPDEWAAHVETFVDSHYASLRGRVRTQVIDQHLATHLAPGARVVDGRAPRLRIADVVEETDAQGRVTRTVHGTVTVPSYLATPQDGVGGLPVVTPSRGSCTRPRPRGRWTRRSRTRCCPRRRQMLWDRAEANGYAHHMTSDPYPNTPAHQVLLEVAFGDYQVASLAAEVQARTMGADFLTTALAEGPGLHRLTSATEEGCVAPPSPCSPHACSSPPAVTTTPVMQSG